jgi:hypothetical protein
MLTIGKKANQKTRVLWAVAGHGGGCNKNRRYKILLSSYTSYLIISLDEHSFPLEKALADYAKEQQISIIFPSVLTSHISIRKQT